MDELRERFYRAYNNLPLGLREEVILVMNDESITWRVARLEIEQDTALSKEILKKLSELKFI